MRLYAALPFALFLTTVAIAAPPESATQPAEENRWEKTIQAFERRDAENPPPKNAVLFVGSSSIRFWNVDKAFPEQAVINRGFGGSQTSDVLTYLDRIVIPYAPRLIVLYVGDNDISYGNSPEQVYADTRTFFERVHAELPDTRIVYIAIKPSLARWHLVGKMRAANALLREHISHDDLIDYLDVDAPMIGDDGAPRPELFVQDGLHLNAEGYALWNRLIRPLLSP